MTRNDNDTDGEVQDTAGPPDRDGDQRLYNTAGPRMDRRTLLKGIGAAGAAATLGTGVASADHGDDDPIDVGDDGDSDGSSGSPRVDFKSAIGGAILFSPAGALAEKAGVDAADGDIGTMVGDWLYGGYEDRLETQLQADLYANAESAANNNAWLLKELDNRLSVSKNNWIAQAQFDSINAINAEKTEAETVAAGQTGVLEAAATVQENLLAIESAAAIRYASFHEREEIADIPDADQVTDVAHGRVNDVLGVKPLHIDLINGETVEAWGLHTEGVTEDGTEVERVHHSHLYDLDLVNTTDPPLPIAAEKMWELVHGAKLVSDMHSSNDDVVVYTDPSDGAEIRAAGAFNSYQRVRDIATGDEVMLLDDNDVSTLIDSETNRGLSVYWTNRVYPLISVIANEIETYVQDVYGKVKSGEISTDDLMTPAVYAGELARDWAETGDTGYTRALLSQLGIDTDLETSMTVTVAPSESPATTLNHSDIGETAEFQATLSNASADVTVELDPGGATDGSGTMHVPNSETLNVRVTPFTDSVDDPAWAVNDVTLTTAAGDTVNVAVSELSDADGTVAAGEAWYDDLDSDGDGSVTISQVDVTYATTSTDDAGNTTTSEYTDTLTSSAGLALNLNADGVGWTYDDAALATDWRPHGGNPDDWSTAAMQKSTIEGVELANTSGPDTVDVTTGWAHDGEPVTNDSAPDTYTVPSDRDVTLQVTGDVTNVDSVTVTTGSGGSYTKGVSAEGFASLAHTDVAAAGESYVIDTVSIEYTDPSDDSSYTQEAGTIGAELAVTDVEIPEYDFMVGNWYHTDNAAEDDQLVISTVDGDWVDIETGDVFRIESATDVDGNELQGVTLSDTKRHTLNVDRIEEEVTRAIQTEQTMNETTSDPSPAPGTDGGDGGGMGAVAAILGGGAVAWAVSRMRGEE